MKGLIRVSTSCVPVPAHSAQSTTVGSPCAPVPKTTTSSPTCTSALPASATEEVMVIQPAIGRRAPSIHTCPVSDPLRGRPSA